MEATCSVGTSLNISGLRGIISQKMELFITTAVRTSNPTEYFHASGLLMEYSANTSTTFTIAHDSGSIQDQIMWDLWLMKWHWGGFSRNILVSPVNFHSINCFTFISLPVIRHYIVAMLTESKCKTERFCYCVLAFKCSRCKAVGLSWKLL
jgi:hypothetical protein